MCICIYIYINVYINIWPPISEETIVRSWTRYKRTYVLFHIPIYLNWSFNSEMNHVWTCIHNAIIHVNAINIISTKIFAACVLSGIPCILRINSKPYQNLFPYCIWTEMVTDWFNTWSCEWTACRQSKGNEKHWKCIESFPSNGTQRA